MKELTINLKATKDKWEIENVSFKVKNKRKIPKWLKRLFQ